MVGGLVVSAWASYTDARVFDIAYGPAHLITRYRPFTTGYDLPFDPPSIWAGVRRRLGNGGWLDGLPRPWRDEPESLAPAPDHSPFWA